MAMIVLVWSGCAKDPSGSSEDVALWDVAAWAPSTRPDPFADERPADARCEGGTRIESSTLEVDTGVCTWLWFEQPALAAVDAGDRLEFVFWHGYLDADEPAQAHVAVVSDGTVAFETWLEVPGQPDAYTESFEAPVAFEAGAPLGLHLHNHGTNSYNFLRLDRLATGD